MLLNDGPLGVENDDLVIRLSGTSLNSLKSTYLER
jgi:hypothetical protein